MNSTISPHFGTSHHIPILLEPIAEFLVSGLEALPSDAPAGIILDCTLGGGGHTARVLEKIQSNPALMKHCVLGIDQDPEAIARNHLKFEKEIQSKQLEVVHSNFSNALKHIGDRPLYGLMADLGISSDQIDSQTRGFSFRFPSPLDMRMNTNAGIPLKDLLMDLREAELADLIWKYGEERNSRRIARKIVELRSKNELPQDTLSLASAIASTFPPAMRHGRIHPATQCFQAFRIAVNEELKELETLISTIFPRVESKGRIAILSFHSLEDRLVKSEFHQRDLYELPSRKAIQADDQEVEENSRSRSAKLRLAIKKSSTN
jgi:16S rRNA (cytosine1402-N4)-methyltransferase